MGTTAKVLTITIMFDPGGACTPHVDEVKKNMKEEKRSESLKHVARLDAARHLAIVEQLKHAIVMRRKRVKICGNAMVFS